jgi:hypothetical protein
MGYLDLVSMNQDEIDHMHLLLQKTYRNVINNVSEKDVGDRSFYPLDLVALDERIRNYFPFELIAGKNIFDSNHTGLYRNIDLWYYLPKKNCVILFADSNDTHNTSDMYVGFVNDLHVSKISKGIPMTLLHKTFHHKLDILIGRTENNVATAIDSLLRLIEKMRKHRGVFLSLDQALFFNTGVADMRSVQSGAMNIEAVRGIYNLLNKKHMINAYDLFTKLYIIYTRAFRENGIHEFDGRFKINRSPRTWIVDVNQRERFDDRYDKLIQFFLKNKNPRKLW